MIGLQWETHNGRFSAAGEVMCAAAGARVEAAMVSEVKGYEV